MTEKEIFKEIPGFPRYKISSGGTVISYTSSRHPEGKKLKVFNDANGYQIVHLQRGTERTKNSSKLCHLHRLVAETWIPVPKELSGYSRSELQVDHIIPCGNGGRIINPETGEFNLRWVTPYQNCTQNEMTNKNRKEAVLKRKMKVYVYDDDLNLVSAFTSTADAARELGKSQGNIASSCTGALPRYLGLIWSYVELHDISEREELERKARPQFEKNRKSTYAAATKCQKRRYKEGRSWYHLHREKANEQSRLYYHTHREEILKKKREKRMANDNDGSSKREEQG